MRVKITSILSDRQRDMHGAVSSIFNPVVVYNFFTVSMTRASIQS